MAHMIAVWNVKGLQDKVKRCQVKEVLAKYDCAILQETHGHIDTCDGWTKDLGFLSGTWDNLRSNAAGSAILSKTDQTSLRGHNGRIAIAKTMIGERNTLVISVYAPNLDKSSKKQEEFSQFLTSLEYLIDTHRKQNRLVGRMR